MNALFQASKTSFQSAVKRIASLTGAGPAVARYLSRQSHAQESECSNKLPSDFLSMHSTIICCRRALMPRSVNCLFNHMISACTSHRGTGANPSYASASTPAPTVGPLLGMLVSIFQAGRGMRSIHVSDLPESYRGATQARGHPGRGRGRSVTGLSICSSVA